MITTDSLQRSIIALASHALLSAEEERELSVTVRAGAAAEARLANGESSPNLVAQIDRGRQARNRLVELNQRLVIAQARRFMNSGVDLVDLIQEGNLGLIRAAEKFDGRKGFRFGTYAILWISVFMTRFSSERRQAIRIPLSVYANVNKINVAREGLLGEIGRDPTVDELATRSGLTCGEVEKAIRLVRVVSLDPAGGGDDIALVDLLADGNAIDPAEDLLFFDESESLHRSVHGLPREQSAVLILKYGLKSDEPMSLKSVAKTLGISPSKAGLLHRLALDALSLESEHPTTSTAAPSPTAT